MQQVTQERLKQALELWDQASERARLESNALGIVLQNQHVLIRSMIANGWTYAQASNQVDEISTSHETSLAACLREASKRCQEYRALEQVYLAQNP